MPTFQIQSTDDPRISVFRDLPRSRERCDDGRFIAEGRILVERLWRSGWQVESVFCDETHVELAVGNSGPGTPIFVAPKPLLEETIGFRFHRGLLACGRAQAPQGIATFVEGLGDGPAVLAILDRVVDQENMGGILRNAAALGAAGVVVGPASARPLSRRVLRVSMGAVFHLPPLRSTDLLADAHLLRQAGFQLIATMDSPQAVPIEACPKFHRAAILFGNEGHGVEPYWSGVADHCVRIPMSRGVDSLNVASASAICIHHFV